MAIHSSDTENQHSFMVQNMHFSDLNPVRCGWHQRGQSGFWGPSMHDYYNLHYVLSGKGEFTCAGQTVKLEKHSMFPMRPGVVVKHEADEKDPWLYAWISFDGNAAEQLLESAGFTGNVNTVCCPELYSIFEDIRQYNDGKEYSSMNLCAKLYSIFDKLSSTGQTGNYETPVAQYCIKAADYIHANYSAHITIEGISKNLGIDRRYFSRIFTRNMGVSPQKYLVDYRLEKAKTLLESGSYSVSEVAISVGYDDIFAFSKIFKKKYGIPPSKCSSHRV